MNMIHSFKYDTLISTFGHPLHFSDPALMYFLSAFSHFTSNVPSSGQKEEHGNQNQKLIY